MIDVSAALVLLTATIASLLLCAAAAIPLWRSWQRRRVYQFGLRALLALLTLTGVLLAGGGWFGHGQYFYGVCWAGAAALLAWVAGGLFFYALAKARHW